MNKLHNSEWGADYYVKGKKLIEINCAEAKKIMKENEEATAILTEIITNNSSSNINVAEFLKNHTEGSIKKDAKLVIDKNGRKYISYKSLEYNPKLLDKYILNGNSFFPSKEDKIKRWAVNKYLVK